MSFCLQSFPQLKSVRQKKKPKIDGKLDSFISKGKEQEAFLKDTVRAFAASNVPLEKLAKGSPIRNLLEKYMTVNGENVGNILVDPDNLRRTWLPKVLDDGMFSPLVPVFVWPSFSGVRKLANIFRERNHYVCIGVDETDDHRPKNEYILTMEVLLVPKVADASTPTDVRKFHLKLEFPSVCVQHASSVLIHISTGSQSDHS